MKTLLIITLLMAGAVCAAPPVVEIKDLDHVCVNGDPAGTVVDAITNAPDCKAAVMDWLRARDKQRDAEAEAKVRKAQDTARAAVDEARAQADAATEKAAALEGTVRKALDAELKTGEGPKAKLLRDLVGEIQKPAKQRRREQLEAELSQKRKELESLK